MKPLPLVGHALALLRRPLEFVTSLEGDLVELRLGPQRAVMVRSPELIQQVLRDTRTFDKGGRVIDKVRTLMRDGLATCAAADHKRQRRLVQPAFHHSRIAGYADIMTAEAAAWRPGPTVDVNAEIQAMAARITGRTLFSSDLGGDVVAEVQRSLNVVNRGIYQRSVAPFGIIEKLPLPRNREFWAAQDRLRSVIDGIITSYRRAGVDHGDVLSMLLAASDESGDALSDAEVHDQVMTLLIAGVDTVANLLVWLVYELTRNPLVHKRLRAEVDDVLAGRPTSYSDLPALEYTTRVITEGLRLHPPVWLGTRVVTADTVLNGRSIRAETTVLYSPYALQRDPTVFPDPLVFDPDRPKAPLSSVVAFGAGARKCIGDHYALIEATLVLATLVSRWEFRPVSDEPIRPVTQVTLSTGPLPMTVTAR